MTTENNSAQLALVVADLVQRIPAMAQDCPTNNEVVLTNLLRPLLAAESVLPPNPPPVEAELGAPTAVVVASAEYWLGLIISTAGAARFDFEGRPDRSPEERAAIEQEQLAAFKRIRMQMRQFSTLQTRFIDHGYH